MNNYNSVVGKIAGKLQDSNMQRHMGIMDKGISSEKEKMIQRIIDYEYNEFIRLIYLTTLTNREKYLDGEMVKKHFSTSEDDLIPIFKKINDDCLDDPSLSNSITNGTPYAKKIGSEQNQIYYYIPNHASSITHDVVMDLIYLPTINDEPNKFRIDVKEMPSTTYPYLNFSVDIGDDGSINYNKPMIIDKPNKDDDSITRTPTDMSSAHIKFNEAGVKAVSDVLVDLFKKTGIKEDSDNKKM